MMFLALTWLMLAQTPATALTGTVTGPDGAPAVGAELVLAANDQNTTVLGRAKVGEAGRFTIDRPASPPATLWAVQPGCRLGRVDVNGDTNALEVRLGPPGGAVVRVLGPDGRPAAGVRVLPYQLINPNRWLPDAVAELAASATDADGRAVLASVATAELTYVDLHTPNLGIQGLQITLDPARPLVINLRPVATWIGQLQAADPADARGWHVRAWTRVGAWNDPEPSTVGYVETTTDDAGRFALKPIALGALQLEFKPPGERPVVPDPPQTLSVRDTAAEVVVIPLRDRPVRRAGDGQAGRGGAGPPDPPRVEPEPEPAARHHRRPGTVHLPGLAGSGPGWPLHDPPQPHRGSGAELGRLHRPRGAQGDRTGRSDGHPRGPAGSGPRHRRGWATRRRRGDHGELEGDSRRP